MRKSLKIWRNWGLFTYRTLGCHKTRYFIKKRLWMAVSALSHQHFRLQGEKKTISAQNTLFLMEQMMKRLNLYLFLNAELLTGITQKCLMLYDQTIIFCFSRYQTIFEPRLKFFKFGLRKIYPAQPSRACQNTLKFWWVDSRSMV